MDYMDPVETARRILNNEPLEEVVDEVDEGKVPPQFLKKNGKDDEDEADKGDEDKEDKDEDEDEDEVDEGTETNSQWFLERKNGTAC